MQERPPGKPGRILLENGFTLEGRLFGADPQESFGEVIFNTAMTGYQEIITDPSYAGQIVTMTYPLIGNYGVNQEDSEHETVHMRGLVIKELSRFESNARSTGSLDQMLKKSGVTAIEGIDTRALTRTIRQVGAIKGGILPAEADIPEALEKIRSSPGLSEQDFVKEVCLTESAEWTSGYSSSFSDTTHLRKENKERLTCAAIDYGAKANIFRCLVQAGFYVKVFPADVSAKDLLATKPDAVFLSNGPGDPALLDYAISTIRDLLQTQVPIFGICLGHQLLGLALGAKTYKLKFGHHGANHPVKDLRTNRIEISSQNHGFALDADSLPEDIKVTHVNLNDSVISGIRSKKYPAMGIQFHPEASPGPHDSLHLFRRFYQLAKEGEEN